MLDDGPCSGLPLYALDAAAEIAGSEWVATAAEIQGPPMRFEMAHRYSNVSCASSSMAWMIPE